MTLQYHKKPIKPVKNSRSVYRQSPYNLSMKEAGGWRIGFGTSNYLVAYGAGVSSRIGMRLLHQLEDDWLLRRKSRRPVQKT